MEGRKQDTNVDTMHDELRELIPREKLESGNVRKLIAMIGRMSERRIGEILNKENYLKFLEHKLNKTK